MDNFIPHCPTSVTSDIFFYSLPALFNLFKAVFGSKVLFGISFHLLSVVLAISLTLFFIPWIIVSMEGDISKSSCLTLCKAYIIVLCSHGAGRYWKRI